MVSLQNYFVKGFGLCLLSLVVALLVHVVIKSLPGRASKYSSPKAFIILWYVLALEFVSLLKVREAFIVPVRAYNFQFFAWVGNYFSQGATSIWQIMLNFLMYAPLGIILAQACKGKKRTHLRLALILTGVSVTNELLQYIFALGVADIDDLLANVLGGLWGSSLYMLWEKIRGKAGRYTGRLIVSCAPIVIACALLISYCARPYGYLDHDFSGARAQVQSVDCSAIQNALADTATVYKTPVLDKKQMQCGAHDVFAAVGQELDLSTYDPYDTVIVYHGVVQSYYIWFWNNGFFELSTMELGIALEDTALSPVEQVYELLCAMGLNLPPLSEAEIVKPGDNGKYQLRYDFTPHGGHTYSGSISWEMEGNKLYELTYNVIELSEVNTYPAKDYAAVCKQLASGNFSAEDSAGESITELCCVGCALQYETDSKGFYRPVYTLQCSADGNPLEITISAI